MKREEIEAYPDKVALIERLLHEHAAARRECYEAKRHLDNLANGPDSTEAQQLRKELNAAVEQLERAGLLGDKMFYCDNCKERTAGAVRNTAAGVGWRCGVCGSPVIKIADLDPVKIRSRCEELKKQRADLAKQCGEHLDRIEVLYKELQKVKADFEHFKLNAVVFDEEAPEGDKSVRAKRSIRF